MTTVSSAIGYHPAAGGDITNTPPFVYDMRRPETRTQSPPDIVTTHINDARQTAGLSLDTSGFQLVDHPSAVTDFLDHKAVVSTYYEECKVIAKALTGASVAHTYDHLVREPGRQISGGGTDGVPHTTGDEAGGGYIGFAHMDYTDNTTWEKYLAVHDTRPPTNAKRIISLNFWRGISPVVDDHPLAICDARTVQPEHLCESVVFGYGAANYSWHNIGIETYSVKHAPEQRWYYYPRMTPNEVLVFKAFDSEGVVGNACPHGAFANPNADPASPPRRSIELRVLCFVTD